MQVDNQNESHIEADANQVKSDIGAGGFSFTATALHQWCKIEVERLKHRFDFEYGAVTVELTSYRHRGDNHLTLDFLENGVHVDSIDFCAYGENTYHLQTQTAGKIKHNYVEIVDMAEALHATGIILQALNVTHVTIGKTTNETNEAVVAYPFVGRQTNGDINLWKDDNSVLHQCDGCQGEGFVFVDTFITVKF